MDFTEFLKVRGKEVPKDRVHFRGHEGISFWLAIDPLYELKRLGVINKFEMEEILHIISLHGTLFNRIKDGVEHKPQQVTHMFETVDKYARFVMQSKCDSLGRFYNSGAGSRADVAQDLGDTLYGDQIFYDNEKPEHGKGTSTPFLHVLVGLPASGKSRWTSEFKENLKNEAIIKVAEMFERGDLR